MTTIDSIGGLIEFISERVSRDNRILWYRGHRSANWKLQATVHRGYKGGDERNLAHRFRSRAGIRRASVPDYDQLAGWLSLMQHYGLPTRLLDWTRSPLVALYFALEGYVLNRDEQPQDATVWVLEPHALNSHQGFEPVTSAIDAWSCQPMLKPAFYHQCDEPGKIMAAMASETDVRMFVQQGCFTIHSNPTPLEALHLTKSLLSQITIPANHVRRMAAEIGICGFRRGDIFPDLQNLAYELATTYAPTA